MRTGRQTVFILLWLLAGVLLVRGQALNVMIQINSTANDSQCGLFGNIVCRNLSAALNLIKSPAPVSLCEILMLELATSVEGNIGIILDGSDYPVLSSLRIAGFQLFIPDNTFFIKMNNVHFNTTFASVTIYGSNHDYRAIEFDSSFSNVTVTLFGCYFMEGIITGPVTLFDMTGSLISENVQCDNIASSADCGCMLVRNYSKVIFLNSSNYNTSSQMSGGFGCFYGREGSEFYMESTGLLSSCNEYGGGLYIEGPGKYTLANQFSQQELMLYSGVLGAKRANAVYATGFDEFNIVNSVYTSLIPIVNSVAEEGGMFYLSSSRAGASVSILNSTLQLGSASELGGLIYVQNVALLNITGSKFSGGVVEAGYGGCVVVDNVHTFVSRDTKYYTCTGEYGGAIACFNGSSIVDFHNVTFQDDTANYMDSSWNIYADSSCSSPFWQSAVDVANCTQCNTTVCGEDTRVLITTAEKAQCFCEGPNCSIASVETSQTSLSDKTNSGMRVTIFITLLTVVCVIVAIVVVGVIGYKVLARRKQRFSPVETELQDEHIQ